MSTKIEIHIQTPEEERAAVAAITSAIHADRDRRKASKEGAEEHLPRLLAAMRMNSGQGVRITKIVWSLWNGSNQVGLCDVLCGLDGPLQDALLALIRIRMSLGGDADNVLRYLLTESGEMGVNPEGGAA